MANAAEKTANTEQMAEDVLSAWAQTPGAAWDAKLVSSVPSSDGAPYETWRCTLTDPTRPVGKQVHEFFGQDRASSMLGALRWLTRPALVSRGEAIELSPALLDALVEYAGPAR